METAAEKLEAAEEVPLDLETILNSSAEKDDYVEVTRCIPRHKIREVKVLDEKHVTFQVGRDKYYLVQMERRCPGLRRNSTVSFETGGTRVCTSDRIRSVIDMGLTHRLGPACRIPGFQEITREQLVLIRDTLRNRR